MAINQIGGTVGQPYMTEFTALHPGAQWTTATSASASASNYWTYMIYANGMFVAVGGNNSGTPADLIQTSTDGTTWNMRLNDTTSRTSTERGLMSVTYGNGTFVALGSCFTTATVTTTCYTSTDGVTWTPNTGLPSNNWSSVIWHSGTSKYIALAGHPSGNRNATARSTDGIVWTSGGNMPSSAVWSSLATNGTTIVAVNGATPVVGPVGSASPAYTTNGGTSWSNGSISSGDQYSTVTYGNGLFVAAGTTSGYVHTSPDGINWTLRGSLGFAGGSVVWTGTAFIVSRITSGTNAGGPTAFSPDGINWWVNGYLPTMPASSALATNGSGLTVALGASVANDQVALNNSTTINSWTCPAGVYSATLTTIGGGAGGGTGTAANASGGGGGAGQYLKRTIGVTPGTTYNIFLGAPGPGGVSVTTWGSPAGSGRPGTQTRFDNSGLLTAIGGGYGGPGATAGGAGGSGGGAGGAFSGGGGGGAAGPGIPAANPAQGTTTTGYLGGASTTGGGSNGGTAVAATIYTAGNGGPGIEGRAGGGGGGSSSAPGAGSCGAGSGAASGAGKDAVANTGSGGGGATYSNAGGIGGSGYLRVDWTA